MDNASIKKLETDLWESADLLRAGSKLTSNQYCMPVLGLLFLRYAYSRYKMVEEEILKDRPVRNGRKMPVEASDFTAKSALFLPEMAQYSWLVALPENVASLGLVNVSGQTMGSLGEVVNNAMELVEQQSEQLIGVLPKSYTDFSDELLGELLRIFNNNALDEVGGDVIGRIYEYFLNKFAKNIASDDGVFFTPKSLVKMIVNILEPKSGVLLDPACGSGGMFVQTGDFVNETGLQANKSMTFYGQEKVEYNAQLCLMNMAVHGLTGVIKSGDEANSFYHDAHNLEGKYKMFCDDGEIDTELFRYITDSPRIKDVPSLIKNKYCYANSDDIVKEMNFMFSDQNMLAYTERTGSKYDNLVQLILNEKIGIADCQPYNQEAIRWLIERGVIYLEDEVIKCQKERVFILKELYEKNVISMQYIKSPILKEMITKGEIVTDNKLLTKPEYQYFDYLLNNSEFSDGKAIRNRYIHDAIIIDERTMTADYYTLLKVIIMIIIKINDDCCLNETIKEEGDFYEL